MAGGLASLSLPVSALGVEGRVGWDGMVSCKTLRMNQKDVIPEPGTCAINKKEMGVSFHQEDLLFH